jgi:hypothetical protein
MQSLDDSRPILPTVITLTREKACQKAVENPVETVENPIISMLVLAL